ncbi:MAG: hypothetical protein QNJ98_02790 [Planctomycetota bacterium]|nr:hypothetical protein [Planctomycetota bacterium]
MAVIGRIFSTLGRALPLLLVLFVGAGVAQAEDADAKARELLSKYKADLKASKDISDDDGWNAFVRRLRSLRELGALDCPRSREGLLRIARKGKRLDDKVLAAQGIARSADLESVQSLIGELGKERHPLLVQATAEALGQTKHAQVRTWLAKAAGELRTPGALAIVLRAGRTIPMDTASLLVHYDTNAIKTSGIDLAFDALRALGLSSDAEATKRVLSASAHADHRLRMAAADVLPARERTEPHDVAIRRLLEDDEPLVRYATLRALGTAERLDLLPAISVRLGDDDRRTRKTALDVLKRMTKQDFGFDGGAWRRWHESKDEGAKPKPQTVVSYYGVPIWSDRLVFILDKSGSMGWPFDRAVTNRMAVAQAELDRVLAILPKGTLFNVISFATKVDLWRKKESPAEPKAIAKAQRWVAKQESRRGAWTNTYGALERTLLQNPRIDTIYLLSDGIPEWGDVICSEGLLAAVRDWNRYRRVTINTFAITHMSLNPGRYARKASMNRAATFMKDLAAAGGGTYRFVNRPPK